MVRTVVIIVALTGLILTGCNSTPERGGIGIQPVRMPDWAKVGEHPDYPSSDYVVAYGLARRMSEATDAAERGLEVMICREAVDSHLPLLKDSHFEKLVTEQAAWFDLAEFGEAVRKDAATDGFEAVAVRAISRNELKLRARSLLITANTELAAAMEPPGGIGSVLDRLDRWGRYFLLAVRVVALELIASDTLNRTAFDKVERALIALWELPALITSNEKNSGQHLKLNGGLAQPLELFMWFRNRPVAGVPLLWGPATGFRGDVQGDKETDADGRATARVHYLAATGDNFAYVQCRLDVDRVVGRKLGIAMSVWLWQVMLPSRETGEIVLNIEEDTGFDPVFVDELRKWCEGRGFRIVDKASELDDVLYHATLEGRPKVQVTTLNGAPVGFVTGTFTLKDNETGSVLFRYTLGLKREGQPGNSDSAVALLALREGATELLLEMAPRLLATFPGKGDEFGR